MWVSVSGGFCSDERNLFTQELVIQDGTGKENLYVLCRIHSFCFKLVEIAQEVTINVLLELFKLLGYVCISSHPVLK